VQATTNREGTERGGIGQGIYSLSELKLYLAFHGTPADADRALYWLENALNPVEHRVRQPDYSFSDLVSLLVVRELVRLGMQPHHIKEAESYLRKCSHTARPFVNEDIATDGKDVFIRSAVGEQVESANHGGGQQAHGEVVGPYLKRVEYARTDVKDWAPAVAWWPTDLVVLNPRVQFGEPVVDGTRVPTSAVADLASAVGTDEAAVRLTIPVKKARAAVHFEQRLAALL
jgi:uncharacterized protein (DUF433 family)